MRKIVRAEAICLRVQDYMESSKLVTLYSPEQGKVNCIARGARRLKSKFGAALDLFAVSRVIYYWRETTSLYNLSDAELVRPFPPLAQLPERFLAAEQMAEFVLRTAQPHDPHPDVYRLLLTNLATLETAENGFVMRVCSFLLKASSFLGFRPELRRCLVCRKPLNGSTAVYFDAGRGGTICPACAGETRDMTRFGPPNRDRVPSPLADRAERRDMTEMSDTRDMTQTSDVWDRVPSRDQPARPARTDCVPSPLKKLNPAELALLTRLLYTPSAELTDSESLPTANWSLQADPLDLVLAFISHHFDPLVLKSFRWPRGLEG